ncbi:MAG: mechanosensitive ion channel domain-containing protein [archaeon]
MVLENYIANDWLRVFVILVSIGFFIRVSFYILEKILLQIASKTKTDADDKLIRKASGPLTFLAIFMSLRVTLTELTISVGVYNVIVNILYTLMIIVIGYLAFVFSELILIRVVKKAAGRTKSEIDDNLISLFESALKVALFIIILLYILGLWGIEITPLLAGLGIAGLAVALALQPLLSNIFSGAAIVLDKTVRVGDLVYLDSQTKGKIKRVGLRSTRVITFDNELIIVPNNKLADSVVQNVALPEPKTRVVIPFGVAYGSDIEKVKKVVLAEIKKVNHLEKDPEPFVRFLEMADSSLNFKAYFWVDSFENKFSAIDEANTIIYNALNKNKINIPFPQVDVHLKK